MAENTYVQLVNRAITSFNNIFNAMYVKGDLLTAAEKAKTDKILTENYGERIARLTYISGLPENVAAPNAISDFTGATKGLSGTSYEYDKGQLVVTGRIAESGYYTNGTTDGTLIGLALDTSTISFKSDHSSVTVNYNETGVSTSGIKSYTVAPKNEVIGAVEILAGGATTTIGSTQHTITGSNDLSVAVVAEGVELEENTYLFETGASSSKSGYKAFTFKANSVASATSEAVASTTFIEGYVDRNDTVTTPKSSKNTGEALNASKDATLFIKEASVALSIKKDAEATAGIKATDETYGESVLFAESGIALQASVADLPLEATIVPGYVSSSSKIDTDAVGVKSSTKYLKKGSAPAQNITVDFGTVSDAATILSTEKTDYLLQVPVSKTEKKSIESGFILDSEAGNITVSGTKDLYIKKGSVTVKSAVQSYTVESGIEVSDSGNANTHYEVVVKPNLKADVVKTANTGIVRTADITAAIDTDTHKSALSAWVKKGKIESTGTNFDVKAVEFGENDKGSATGTLSSIGSLFRDDLTGITGDYFTVDATYGYDITEGYIEGDTLTGGFKKYVPKAVFNWVEAEGEEYLEVTVGGYLPSGRISDLAVIPQNDASVTLSATSDSFSIKKASDLSDTKGYYKFTVGHVVNAGYISDTTKDAFLNTEYYVKSGSVSVAPSASISGVGDITRKVTEGVVTYNVPLTVSANANLQYEAGYLLASNVDTTKATQTNNLAISLDRATLASATHNTEVALTSTTVVEAGADETSAFIITPAITKCETTILMNAGYIGSTEDDKITHTLGAHAIKNAEAAVFKIHAGDIKKADVVLAGNTLDIAAIVNNKIEATAVDGLYTLSLEGNISTTGKIGDDGYYVAQNFNATKAITPKTFKIKQGSVTPSGIQTDDTISVQVGGETVEKKGIYSTSAVLHDEKATGKSYVELKVEAQISSSATIEEGYVKAGEVGDAATGKYSSAKYIETYTTVEHQIGQTAEYLVPDADPEKNEEIVIQTAGKYMTENIKVTLSDNAMGKSVVASMKDLEDRLNGIF